MKCFSYCTAHSYDMVRLGSNLKDNGLEIERFDDVIYVQKEAAGGLEVDIFFFSFGTVVIWGSDETQNNIILREIKEFEIGELKPATSDQIHFSYNIDSDRSFIDEEKNEIMLSDRSALTKLSISHAVAQSARLEILEVSVNKLLDSTSRIRNELAVKGEVSMSKKDLSKQIGLLFNERYSVNLHSDMLGTPEFFWRRPRYEPIYLMTAEFFDISIRQGILDKRLNMIHELYDILSNELNYKNSARLEITIVFLIAIEILLALIHNDSFTKLIDWVF